MKIEHIALWVADLEAMRQFYETHFDATTGERYHNPTKGFTSYFLTFSCGARL
ncbi:MAG TPA: glyoxalase/bleomycin resistance/extradiol dioxygenase family protein, partial [Exiguobacterium sp.]|nr:glyoxalase/bleomycin resistance/extradiol dioxygenase family protein [Exiguobacterium sp.]